MDTVEPIREVVKIMAIKAILKASHPRDYLLFTLGINLALRVGDLLSLKAENVLNKKGDFVDYIYLREEKTGKEKTIKLNKVCKDALRYYFTSVHVVDPEIYLFTAVPGQKGQPLHRVRVWQLVKKWTKAVGLTGKYGTHTLRKTWGYMARKQGIPLELIQKKLGHSSPLVTQRYIGITADEIADVEERVNL